MEPRHLERLRALVHDCVAKHMYASAVFFADKVLALSGDCAQDVFLLAQAYFLSKQYRRALALLRRDDLEEHPVARYTVAKCHAECGDWQACLQALGEGEADDRFATIRAPTGHADLGGAVSLEAAVYLLRGRACAELDNRAAAIAMYRAALKLDPYCYEALAALLDNHMLTNQEELALVAELPIRPEDGWLHTLYRVKCKKYNQVHTIEQQLQQLERPATGRAGGAAASAGDMMTPSTPAGPASAALITPYGTAVAPAQRPAAGNAGDNADTAPRSSPGSRGGAMMQQPTPDGMDTGTSGRLPRPQFRSATATPATRLRGNSAEDMEGVETEGGGDGGAPLLAAEGSEEDMGGTAKAHGRAGDVGGGSTPAPAPQPPVGGSGGWGLGGSVDVQTCRAEWALHRGAYEQCYALTSRLLERDACALQALPAHLVAALQLGKKSDLFLRGHKLVEAYPHLALSWFAVGCYYMCTGSYENARSYFGKATTLEPSFAPAWVAFGHAFAAQDERDQAMAAYRSAARLFPGLHTPLLGMGMEYLAMNNLQLAEHMLLAAHATCPEDPQVCHELGVLMCRAGLHQAAETWLTKALEGMPGMGTGTGVGGGAGAAAAAAAPALGRVAAMLALEPSLVALGHVYRKQQRYGQAVEVLGRAVGLNPGQAGTHSALAYTHHLAGDLGRAIESYHRALALKPEDPFALEMLEVAMKDFASAGEEEAVAGVFDGGITGGTPLNLTPQH